MPTIYRKTAKGQLEIETRALKLAPRFRSLLIMVDGRRSDDELAQLMPQLAPGGIEALAQSGLIEAIGLVAEPAARAPAPAAAPVPPTRSPNFESRRKEAVRALLDLVGPGGETTALKLERAKDDAELAVLIGAAEDLILRMRGRGVADSFARRTRAASSAGP
jgi:hypothetical protein